MMNNRGFAVTERDKRVIALVTRMSDTELFGLECYIAGARAAGRTTGQQAAGRRNAQEQEERRLEYAT